MTMPITAELSPEQSPPLSTSGRIKVVTVDDHPAIQDALADAIEGQMDLHLCGQASTTQQVFQVVADADPDVIVLDISLGDGHGLDLVQSLKAQYENLRALIFSVYDERVYAERAIRAGAVGYVMKKEPTSDLIEAIRTVARGDVYLSRRMSARLLSMVAGSNQIGPGFAIDGLTDREMEVFQMLGEGKSVKQIAGQLNLSRKTIETYRRRAKEKLGLGSIAELLQYAIEWTHGQADAPAPQA